MSIWDVAYYRHLSTSSATVYHHWLPYLDDESVGGISPTNGIVAYPLETGDGGTIVGGLLKSFSPDSHAVLRLAIYARTSATDPYPGLLFADLGSISVASALVVWSCAAVVTSRDDLYWVAWTINSDNSMDNFDANAATLVYGAPRTGFTSGAAENDLITCSFGYSSCWPATFPVSSTIDGTPKVPRIMLKYGAFTP
jgi:hypothetical protein